MKTFAKRYPLIRVPLYTMPHETTDATLRPTLFTKDIRIDSTHLIRSVGSNVFPVVMYCM